MYSFSGKSCPVCGRAFTDDDDIVVCPDCGTPHHRECYNQAGHCFNHELHEHGYQYSGAASAEPSDNRPEQDSADGDKAKLCRRCGAGNPDDADFCIKCGQPFDMSNARPNFQSASSSPVAMYIDPYGGVDPNDTIDGVKVSDLACFVGANSQYYIPRFKSMSENGKRVSINWSALILGPYWLAFRKQLTFSVILSFILVVVGAPLELLMNSELLSQSNTLESLLPFAPVFIPIACLLMVLTNFIPGFFGNYIYMKHCIKRVKSMTEQNGQLERIEFLKNLTLNGNVSVNSAIIVYFVTTILQTLFGYFLAVLL